MASPTRSKRRAERNRGQIQAKGDGKWLVRVYVGRDLNGKRKYASKVIEGTFKQADQERVRMLRDQDTGTFIEPSKLSLAKYLESWLETKAGLSAKSLRDYTHLLAKHVTPHLGMFKLVQLTPLLIGKLYGSLSSDHKLSARTVRYTHSVLSQALTQAVEWNMLQRNPCTSVELPRMKQGGSGDTLTFEETACLLEKSTNDRLHALWRLLLTAGLRPQEALALKWSDLSDARLSITRALKETEPGKWIPVEETKTGKGRMVALSAETLSALSSARVSQSREILKQGSKYTRNDFIFATRTGHHFTIPNVRRYWKAALASAEIREVRLYDTRHTNISQELKLGVPPQDVADRHGHDVVTMMNTYRHFIAGGEDLAPKLVEQRLALVKIKEA